MNSFLFYELIFLFYSIISVFYLIYLILDFIIFLLFLNNKITTPIYLPDFLQFWFLNKENIVKKDVNIIRAYLDLDIKNIFITAVFSIIFITIYFIL